MKNIIIIGIICCNVALITTSCISESEVSTIKSESSTVTSIVSKIEVNHSVDKNLSSQNSSDYISENEDIELTVNGQKSFIIQTEAGKTSEDIVFYAVPKFQIPNNTIDLYEADSNEIVSELTLTESGFYKGTLTVNTDIDKNKDVSEDVHYFYYAMYNDENVSHTSPLFDVWVTESFSDKELSDMKYVQEAITDTMASLKYSMADADKRIEIILELLNNMASEDKIEKDSICVESDVIGYKYKCGVIGSVSVKELDSN